MTLTLTMLRCPDRVAPETREIQGGDYSIGRGAENDWVLPDPERYLSKRHCMLAFRSGGWQLADLSTNGTFLNHDSEPVGSGPRHLNDGDRLRMGAYEIEVRIVEAAQPPVRRQPAADPFALDPFAAQPAAPAFQPDPLLAGHAEPDPFAPAIAANSFNLPPDYNPLAPEPADSNPFVGPTAADHTPHLEDAFRAPRVVLPEDWDRDLLAAPFPAAPPTAPNALASPFMAPAAVPIPPPPAAAPIPVAPEPPTAPLPAAHEPTPPTRMVVTPPPAAAAPAPVPAAVPAAAAGPDLLAAFLRGAGLEEARPADPAATMEALGAALRAAVSGLRQTLIARAAIKSEFRIEQTMIRRSGNNPLKFSADDEDALMAMLGAGRRTDMAAAAAITDALDDIRAHELATVNAMQQALRKLLAEFDPGRLRQAGEKNALNFTNLQKKAHAWDAFEALYARVVAALSDDFESVFGRAFAQAYEQAVAEVAAKDPAS
jgi:type VI secretion system FHA domain protein